jgi:hypothetical protein
VTAQQNRSSCNARPERITTATSGRRRAGSGPVRSQRQTVRPKSQRDWEGHGEMVCGSVAVSVGSMARRLFPAEELIGWRQVGGTRVSLIQPAGGKPGKPIVRQHSAMTRPLLRIRSVLPPACPTWPTDRPAPRTVVGNRSASRPATSPSTIGSPFSGPADMPQRRPPDSAQRRG